MSVSPPDAETFHEVPSPPWPFAVIWESNDGTMRFGIASDFLLPGVKLPRDIIETGMAEELGGKPTRSTKKVDGHDVWVMKVEGAEITTTWAIVRLDRIFYKLIIETDSDHSDSELVDQFIDSLSITAPAHQEFDSDEDSGRALTGNPEDATRIAVFESRQSIVNGCIGLVFAVLVFVVARRIVRVLRRGSNQPAAELTVFQQIRAEIVGQWSTSKGFALVIIAGMPAIYFAQRSLFGAAHFWLAISILGAPTGLFAAAFLASGRSERMQRVVAIVAGVAGGLFFVAMLLFLTIGGELVIGGPFPVSGYLLGAAWFLQAFLSVVITIIATIKWLTSKPK